MTPLLIPRRRLMTAAAATGLTAATGLAAAPGGRPAHAATTATDQVAGWYRRRVGDAIVTVASDGWLDLQPISLLGTNAPEDELVALLDANFLPTDRAVGYINVTHVQIGGRSVLIDAGGGVNSGFEALGRLADTLALAGIEAASVDTIVLTHAHPDHSFGILDDAVTGLRFPNADYALAAAEHDFWTAEETLATAPAEIQGMVQGIAATLQAVAERTRFFAPGDEVVPGLTAIDTGGHTPGHVSYRIADGDAQLVVVGDAAVHPIISLTHPDWSFAFDMDGAAAAASRRRLLDLLAADRIPALAYHFPFPGIGHVAADGAVWRWVAEPFDWTP